MAWRKISKGSLYVAEPTQRSHVSEEFLRALRFVKNGQGSRKTQPPSKGSSTRR